MAAIDDLFDRSFFSFGLRRARALNAASLPRPPFAVEIKTDALVDEFGSTVIGLAWDGVRVAVPLIEVPEGATVSPVVSSIQGTTLEIWTPDPERITHVTVLSPNTAQQRERERADAPESSIFDPIANYASSTVTKVLVATVIVGGLLFFSGSGKELAKRVPL